MSYYDNQEENQQTFYKAPPQINRTRPYVSYTIIAINVLVYAAMLLFGRLFDWSRNEQLYYFGAKENISIIYFHEYWRLFTCMFLHGGIMHLACNCFSIYAFGPLVERLYGRWRFIAIYIASGLAGSFLSFALSANASVGASGAIFGLMSSMFYFRKRHRDIFRRIFGVTFFAVIALNLLIGFQPNSGIDNFGHIGGIIGGLLAANAVGLLGEKVSPIRRIMYLVLYITFCIVCVFVRIKYNLSL